MYCWLKKKSKVKGVFTMLPFAWGARYTCHWMYVHKISLKRHIINWERELGECSWCITNYPQPLWLKTQFSKLLSFAGQSARVLVICWVCVGPPRCFTHMAERSSGCFWEFRGVAYQSSYLCPFHVISPRVVTGFQEGVSYERGARVPGVPGRNCKASCDLAWKS